MPNHIQQSLVRLHAAVLLFGLSAILGDLISLSSAPLVFWRLLISALVLLLILALTEGFSKMMDVAWKVRMVWLGIGIVMAIHWVAFFASIKTANASVALVCLATSSFFTALLEPYFLGSKIQRMQVLWSLLVIPGMALVMGGVSTSMLTGVGWGLLSAFLLAVVGVLNKKLVWEGSPLMISFVEICAGSIFMGTLLLLYYANSEEPLRPQASDWSYLIVLAVGCTVIGQILALGALRHLSAFTSMIALNLEPIYGILLAHLWLQEGEELSTTFYIGVLLILAAIFIPLILSAGSSKPT